MKASWGSGRTLQSFSAVKRRIGHIIFSGAPFARILSVTASDSLVQPYVGILDPVESGHEGRFRSAILDHIIDFFC